MTSSRPASFGHYNPRPTPPSTARASCPSTKGRSTDASCALDFSDDGDCRLAASCWRVALPASARGQVLRPRRTEPRRWSNRAIMQGPRVSTKRWPGRTAAPSRMRFCCQRRESFSRRGRLTMPTCPRSHSASAYRGADLRAPAAGRRGPLARAQAHPGVAAAFGHHRTANGACRLSLLGAKAAGRVRFGASGRCRAGRDRARALDGKQSRTECGTARAAGRAARCRRSAVSK